ncbi:probable very-long-chain enoyl-CoA reductase art-1 [Actinia tenebrosa]|uniref:very-long-chain enoyl-CoA reductase n=1 Tax=Actinia tenebrosa TaxID=6105 RepID=A0A6P8HG74_ACTTE|nr:probable very-long-chain enoyl-CoA reductase art-1 [Actinia tenebrosa]
MFYSVTAAILSNTAVVQQYLTLKYCKMKLDVLEVKSLKVIASFEKLKPDVTIGEIKDQIHAIKPKLYPSRQSLRIEPRGKSLKDEDSLKFLEIVDEEAQLYLKDLGPQIGWTTVFLAEYAGPLVLYLLLYTRPALIYGPEASAQPIAQVVHIAAACWGFHYAKRILETLFIHRFSKGTMPISNLIKNCSYYWGFGFFVGYFINHPLYTPPKFGDAQVYAGLAGFLFNELGNFSIHCALRDLRPAGSKERRIPYPNSNPMTQIFNFVSCPNYTYEIGAWICFTLMTQTLGTAFFTMAGTYQMVLWAEGKHRNYKKEFKDYPRRRRAIFPFII